MVRQYIYINDVVQSIACALSAGFEVDDESINVSGGAPIQVGEIADIVTGCCPTRGSPSAAGRNLTMTTCRSCSA